MNFEITTYLPEFGTAIENLQKRYIAANPKGTKFVPQSLYYQLPASEGGKNVFCIFENNELVGYGALFPQPAAPGSAPEISSMIWIHIRVEPGRGDSEDIQDALYECIYEKSRIYARAWEARSTKLAISYPESRGEEIAFFAGRGLQRFDALLQMCRDLSLPTRAIILPVGITIQRWGMKNNEAKLRYIAASVSAFPQALQTTEDIDFYMRSWQGGTPIIAFDPEGEIVGGLMAFWYDKKNGVTEDIFVLPPWRRQGIASCLVVEGIKFLAEQQVELARLEVKESNTAAVRLYRSLGYQVINREEQWAMTI